MVAEGVDGAPRDWGELGDECVGKLICPAVGDDLWREIVAKHSRLGWRVKLDLFASESNARCSSFCSRGPGVRRALKGWTRSQSLTGRSARRVWSGIGKWYTLFLPLFWFDTRATRQFMTVLG